MDDFGQLSDAAQADREFYNYLTKAYQLWLSGVDDFKLIDRDLYEKFGMSSIAYSEIKDEKNEKAIKRLSSEFEVLEKEWASLSQSEVIARSHSSHHLPFLNESA